MIELFQAEWCPYSRMVRQRLTELGIDFVARQVAPAPEDRGAQREEIGSDSIPALVLNDGTVLAGTDAILAHLDRLPAGPDAAGHRRQAVAHGMTELP